MARPSLVLYVDVVSPFAYLAFHVIHCDVTYVPILLGGVFKACNNTPPLRVKNKDVWINNDRIRWAKHFNIPILDGTPDGFPTSTVSAMRTVAALQLTAPDKVPDAVAALYKAYWVEGKAIDTLEVVRAALREVVGEEEAKALVEATSRAEVKQRLVRNTEEAVGKGAFGLPYFVATDGKGETEKFFGFDHLGQVLLHLGLDRGDMTRAML